MGFPVGYSGILVPKLVLNVAYVLGFFRSAVYWLLRPLGFRDFLETEISLLEEDNPWTLELVRSSVSAQRIREQLPVVRFGVLAKVAEVVCAVCLDNVERHDEIRKLMNCNHIFHRGCLDKWLDHGQQSCPFCRSPFLSDNTETEMEEDLRMLDHSSNHFGNFSAVLSH